MYKNGILYFLASLLLAAPSYAERLKCTSQGIVPNSVITIRSFVATPKLHTKYDKQKIKEFARESGNATRFSAHNIDVPGLTVPGVSTATSIEISGLKDSRASGVCAWVTKADIDYDLLHLDVYIARDYEAYSCEYREILEHERRHVKAQTDLHRYYVKLLKERLANNDFIPLQNRPLWFSSLEVAKNDISKRISKEMKIVVDEYRRSATTAHDKIDTKEEYDRVAAACSDW